MPAPKKYSDELRERARVLPWSPVARSPRSRETSASTRRRCAPGGGTPTVLSSAEREELKRLRGEVRELRQANEILKAASVFFAKELDGTPRR